MQVLKEEVRKANKDHNCQACYWWSMSNFGKSDVSPEDWEIIERVQNEGWQILKGQQYLYQSFVHNGTIQTFKGRLDMNKICWKYGLYPED